MLLQSAAACGQQVFREVTRSWRNLIRRLARGPERCVCARDDGLRTVLPIGGFTAGSWDRMENAGPLYVCACAAHARPCARARAALSGARRAACSPGARCRDRFAIGDDNRQQPHRHAPGRAHSGPVRRRRCAPGRWRRAPPAPGRALARWWARASGFQSGPAAS